MSNEQLEHLISRALDGESTPREHQQLREHIARDADARKLFEQTRRVDTRVGDALLAALRPALRLPRTTAPPPRWTIRVARTAGLAAAACVGILLWLLPTHDTSNGVEVMRAGGPSWFSPPPVAQDSFTADTSPFERPRVRIDESDSEWIVVPSDEPGEYLIIQVKRTNSRTVKIQQDF